MSVANSEQLGHPPPTPSDAENVFLCQFSQKLSLDFDEVIVYQKSVFAEATDAVQERLQVQSF